MKNVDTGMGLERMAALLQGVDNIYEIDTTYKILERAAELTEQDYGTDHRSDVGLRVVADHVRSAVMLIEDGVRPGNEGGSYVLRRLLRRSIRNLRLLSRRAAGRRRVVGHRVHARADRDHHRRDGRAVPRAAPRRGHHPPGHRRGGRGLRRHAPHRHRDLRRGGGGDQAQARQRADRRAGVPAPRHLRLPDRPHPGDGGRAGPRGGRGGLPPADGRAAGPGQEGRAGEEDRQRRHLRLRLAARAGGQGHLHRLRHGRGGGDRGRPARERRAGERGHPRHGGRGRARPDPVLRRGRRPAQRPRRDQDQRRRRPGRGPGDRRADPAARPGGAPRHGPLRRDQHRVPRLRGDRRRAQAGHVPQPHRDPPGPPRAAGRAGRVGRAGGLGERARHGSGSTSTRPARSRSRSCARSRTRSTGCSSTT